MPQKRSFRVKLYQAVRLAEEVKTLRERLLFLRFTYIAYDVVFNCHCQ